MYIERDIFPEVIKHIEEPEITLLVGARQVGKTILLEQIKQYLLNEIGLLDEQILTFNLDIIRDLEILSNQTDFINLIKKRSIQEKLYVFVDEAQHIHDAGRFFKGVYDSNLNVKLILTGSSTLEINSKIKESMAGRKRIFHIYPFSFYEYVRSAEPQLLKVLVDLDNLITFEEKQLLQHYRDYLVFGGYPKVVLASSDHEKIKLLEEIYSSYVEKDIRGFLEIRNVLGFHTLVRLVAGQIGQLVNVHELAMSSALDRGTIERYLHVLKETFVLGKLSPYFRNTRLEIVKSPKYYFLDTGIRNQALQLFNPAEKRPDIGQLFENSIFSSLQMLQDANRLRFWRTKNGVEVDFIIEHNNELIPIETKWHLTKPRLPSGLKAFIREFSPKQAFVVSTGYRGHENIATTKVFFLHPYELERIFSTSVSSSRKTKL